MLTVRSGLLVAITAGLLPLFFIGQSPPPVEVAPGLSMRLGQGVPVSQPGTPAPGRLVGGGATGSDPAPGPVTSLVRIQSFFTALTFGFGLLHLILFVFLPWQRSNLYYALFLLVYAAAIFLDFQEAMTEGGAAQLLYLRLHRAANALSFVFALRFFNELFAGGKVLRFWALSAGILIAGVCAVVEPVRDYWMVQVVIVLSITESMRLTLRAIRRGVEDARIIGAGFLIFVIFASYDLLLDFAIIKPVHGIENAYQFGTVGLFIATSAFLARNIVRANERLLRHELHAQEKELEGKILEAELGRKSKELDEARALQLSMIPRALPSLPGLRVAVHLQSATEVGGDYYDFHRPAADTLVIAVGDATGHGLKAGIMVAIAKSLFESAAEERDFPRFFDRCTRILKQMRLGNLFMALTMVRIEGGRLLASAAGMPPLLVYRARSAEVEEFEIRGMPLGAFVGYKYRQVETELAPGDTLLLLTDGLPEMFDGNREMLGWTRVKELFQEAADGAPQEVIARLREAGDQWRDGHPAEDDVTLVVVQAAPALDEALS